MINIQNISVDITARNTNPPPIITAKQFDNTSRKVIATIYDNGVLANISSDATIAVFFGGIKGNSTCYIDGLTATGSDVEFIIPQTALLFEGNVPCEIQISDNEEIIATMNFYIKVEKSVYSEKANVGADNGNVIIPAQEALKTVEELSKEVDKKAEKNYVDNELEKKADKEYVDNLSIKKKVVSELPTENIRENTIYLVPKEKATDDDKYDEFIFIPNEEVKNNE